MALSLDQLPPEILVQILAHCETARTLLNLNLTGKRLNHLVQTDGFRVFVQNRFPSFQCPPYWKDAAHSLTTWSRNWDHKAFIAHYIEPYKDPGSKPFRTPRFQRNQTMGYRPIIDSYEQWVGGNWSSRKEVVAWGGGAKLILRLRRTGDEAETAWQAHREPDRRSIFDQHHHMHEWVAYQEHGLVDGRDDITSTNIVRSKNILDDKAEHILVGRASGKLDRVAIVIEASKSRVVASYDTGKRSVRSATVNSASEPLLAACLAESAVALYSTNSQGTDIKHLAEVSAIPPGRPGRTWSSRFLRQDRLAIGRGPSGQPLLIYGINEAGFSNPIRKYQAGVGESDTASGGRLIDETSASSLATSVYPIAPIAPSSAAGGAEGDIFLSGGYDGNIRLHDLRSPADSTAVFMDLTENSAIYSLLPFGRERFVAGACRHAMIKVFDLRMPGGKLYHSSSLESCSPETATVSRAEASQFVQPCCDYHHQAKAVRGNYSMFLGAGGPRNRRSESAVYSLSAPSPFSPTFYAGIEDAVVQFDVVSALDRHPDPLFTHGLTTGPGTENGIRKWDPQDDALTLRLYDRVNTTLRSRYQQRLNFPKGRISEKGWDERWR